GWARAGQGLERHRLRRLRRARGGRRGARARLPALDRARRPAVVPLQGGRRARGRGDAGRRPREAHRTLHQGAPTQRGAGRGRCLPPARARRREVLLRRHHDRGPRSTRQEQGLRRTSRPGGPSMTKRDLIDEVVKLFPRFSRRDAEVIVNEVFDSLTQALVRGERIEIRGFGSFVVKQRQAREGRNPKTGALVPVHAKRVPFFKVGKELRLRVDGKPWTPEDAEAIE